MNTINNEKSSKIFKLIKPLSQNELAGGWQLVVPKIKYNRNRKYEENTDDSIIKKQSNIYRSKINMSQLPFHLWKKTRKLNNGNKKVFDNSHLYYIENTNVDDEIYELTDIIMRPYNISNSSKVIELLNVLKDNDIYGWIVIQATNMYLSKE